MSLNDKIIFVPLGGAQEVGASCYYLKLGGYNFLLDCGVGQTEGITFTPKFNTLLQIPYLQDFHQISHVFISHAHLDHVAALPDFFRLNERITAYMTDFTFQIAELQLGYKFSSVADKNISRVTFLQEIPMENLSISFHPAGHIPGAMMTLFKFRGKNILYTGDYSTAATELVAPAIFPNENIDVLIICAVHARHSMYQKNNDATKNILRKIIYAIKNGRKVYCHVNQISKGVELIALINKNLYGTEIFIDNRVMKMVNCFENQHIPIMTANTQPLKKFVPPSSVVISTYPPRVARDTEIVRADFSLHDDFNALVRLVEKVNPKLCVVVHSPPDKKFYHKSIEQILMRNPNSRTSFIFPELCQPYEI